MKPDVSRIKSAVNNQMPLLRNSYKVKSLGVFGSVARGDETRTSDIDFLVEFSEPISFFKFLELEEFLGKTVGGRVDLVTKNALKTAIKDEVLREVIYV